MSHKQKYDEIFMDSFSISKDVLGPDLAYSTIEEWDSIGHMTLIAALEEAFDISMDMDDVIDFSSYTKGPELLSKYGVEIY